MIKHTAFERSLRNLNFKKIVQTMRSEKLAFEQSLADIFILSIRREFKREYKAMLFYSDLFVKAMKAYNQ